MTVMSTLRLPVVAKMSRAQWPSSPTALSCGCLHRVSNTQAVSKTGEAARACSCRWRVQVALRGGRRASRRAHSWVRRGSVRRACARVRARLQHAHRSRERARSGRADRKLRALHAWLPAGPRHTCGWWVDVPGLEEVGDEVDRGVDRLAPALVPRRVYCDGCAWVLCAVRVLCARSGVCGGAFV